MELSTGCDRGERVEDFMARIRVAIAARRFAESVADLRMRAGGTEAGEDATMTSEATGEPA